MKKIFKDLLYGILAILILVALVLAFPFLLVWDYVKYKRSYYYRKKRKKYHFMMASGKKFQLYNDIFEHDIPIEFVENPKDRDVEKGQFLYKDILIIVSEFWFKFNRESNEWRCTVGHDDEEQIVMELNEYIEMEIESVNVILGETICKDAVVLIDSEEVDDIELAKTNPQMLVYHGDRVQTLKEFCK